MIVLIINGAAGAGKDTAIKMLREEFSCALYSYSSIDWVKKVAMDQFGWDGHKTPESRILLAELKQAAIKFDNIPFRKVTQKIVEADKLDWFDAVSIDIREPVEINKIVNWCHTNHFKCLTVRIHNVEAEREAEKNGLSEEGDLSYMHYDYYDASISNNGSLNELRREIIKTFSDYFLVEPN